MGGTVRRPRPCVIRWLAVACIFFAALFVSGNTYTQTTEPAEPAAAAIKAAYLYKFGNFVHWPARSQDTTGKVFTIGIISEDGLADELKKIVAGRSVMGLPVVIRKLRTGDPMGGINVLFVGRSHNSHLADILAAVKGKATLTVTESDKGLELGGMINFVTIDGKLRFEVAPKAAELESIAISARLLAAAYKVAVWLS